MTPPPSMGEGEGGGEEWHRHLPLRLPPILTFPRAGGRDVVCESVPMLCGSI